MVVTPKSLVLDLLRVAAPRSIPVRSFVELGELFGFTGSAVRVAVARLVASELVESDERGSYRLAAGAAPLSRHVEAWRRGEERVRPWSGEWLSVWLPRGGDRRERKLSRRALSLAGFREALSPIWIRPDNLAGGASATFRELSALGLESAAKTFVAHDFAPALVKRWKRSLWETAKLEKRYARVLGRIEDSRERLFSLPLQTAAVEAFLVGGEAIRVLATDPLLPSEILPCDTRARLTQAMLDYDRVGRTVWADLTHPAPPLELVQGGAA